jgi:hypothetical protein
VAEDPEAAGEEHGALTVVLDVLVGQEPNGGLGDGEPNGRLGVGELLGRLGRGGYHGSGSFGLAHRQARIEFLCSQLLRSQVWSGLSQISQARLGPDPAITFR